MTTPLPLEDNFNDVIGKAQRGLAISDNDLISRAGISADDLAKIKAGEFDEAAVTKVAPVLNLGTKALVELGKKAWYPEPQQIEGLHQYTTKFEDMTVNSYLVFDILTKVAYAFDSGADATEMLGFIAKRWLRTKIVFLTHIHPDHIAALQKLQKTTFAKVYVSEAEPIPGAETFPFGKEFSLGNFDITARRTTGHAKGGVTYVISGLKKPIAIVGDAVFCCSMGGGAVSYEEALQTNRESIFSLPDNTVLCPGHGPMTTVGEQKKHNPFFPEFQK